MLPAFLALALVVGTPGVSIGSSEAGATQWNALAAPSQLAHGNLSEDVPDAATSPRPDQDDPTDDRVAESVVVVFWQDGRVETPVVREVDIVGLSHEPCAAPARGPPNA